MIHINRFIDKIASAESKNLKHLNLTIQEAKSIHSDITKLLLVLQELQHNKEEDVTKVEVDGGKW